MMHTSLRTSVLLVFLFMLLGVRAQATTPTQKDSTWYKHAQLNSSPGDSTLYVRDSVGSTSTCNRVIQNATINAFYYMGDPYKFGSKVFATEVKLRVNAYSTFVGTSGLVDQFFVTLDLSQDIPEQLWGRDFTNRYSLVNRFVVHVVSYTAPSGSSLQDSVHLGFYIKENWATGVKGVSITTATNTTANPALFQWHADCKNVPNYQVQILRLYNTDSTKKTETSITANIDWTQATSIETGSKDTSLSLTLAEGQGYYIWRVRPIGSYYPGGIADSRNWGTWNVSTTGSTAISSSSGAIFFYHEFNDTLNWIYSRTFSEGDPNSPKVRMSEKITYANGLQQVKQTQAHIQSLHQVLVSQTIYDWSGRAALVTLPAPISRDSMAYKQGFAKYNSSTLYSQAHFDEDSVYFNPKPMANCFLAGYYSDTIADKFIPNSEGYPFSRALYERDGTARVKEQGGPGNTHRIRPGIEHTTKTYYSGVSDQELIRVLGDEAPSAQSVHKVINVDANQTASVTYMSKEGQAIITCLAIGMDSTSILDTLPSQKFSRFTVLDTVKGNTPYGNYGITSSKPFTFAVPTAVTIKYGISSQNVQQLCMSYCKNCDYNVEFLIKGDNYTLRKTHLITAQNCTTPHPGFDTTFTVNLAAGSYVLEKRVYANNYVPNSLTDSTETQHYLDSELSTLRKMFQDSANAKLATVCSYLTASNTTGLYTYLHTTLGLPVTHDSIYSDSSFVFNIKCNSIKIPILTCNAYNCNGGRPDFEGYFNTRWAASSYVGTDGNGFLKYFPNDTANGMVGYKPGQFNYMIYKMLAETGAHAYTCNNLWTCWVQAVQSYGSLKSVADSTSSFKVDLLKEFLTCAGTQYIGFKSAPVDTNLWRSKAYEYFYYYKGKRHDCDTAMYSLYGALPWNQDTLHGLATNQKYRNYRDCEINEQIPSKQTSSTGTASAVCGCESACENKLESFKQALIRMYHNDSIYVEGDVYKLKRDTLWGQVYGFSKDSLTSQPSATYFRTMANIECAARSLVDNAKKSCVLTTFVHAGTGKIDSVGTKAQLAAMEQVMNSSFQVKIPSCGAGWTSIKPITSSDTSFVRLWEKHYGSGTLGSGSDDRLWDIVQDKSGCGGYVLAGWTNSIDTTRDISQGSRGNRDYWVIKVNQEGNKVWDARFGGSLDDTLRSIVQTMDEGYLLGGTSRSGISGDKSDTSRNSSADYWAVKIDANGKLVWNKTFGGSGTDILQSVNETSDGRYLLGGYSNSRLNGDKSQDTVGGYDYWLIKVNQTTGAKIWDKRYGTHADDKMMSVRTTKDNNILMAGYTAGTSGAGSYLDQATRGGNDYWIIKANQNGDTLWNKRYGGSSDDFLYAMEPIQATGDSSFILAGISRSAAGGDKTKTDFGNAGKSDYWVIKVDKAGTALWDSIYGGTNNEGPFTDRFIDIKETKKKGFFIGGGSISSPNTGNKTDSLYPVGASSYDYWAVRIDSTGHKLWDRSFGGSLDEFVTAVDVDIIGDYWIAGYSYSDSSTSASNGNKKVKNYGATNSTDFYVVRGRDYCTHDSICFKWVTPAVIPDSLITKFTPISCDSISSQMMYESILSQVGQYIQTELDSFKTNYMNTCAIASNIKDTLTVSYPLGYHHYTLYYYDRAGNLVRTVPPAGVVYYAGTRLSGTTSHTMKTMYKYNSIKQLVQQQTPDGGITNFWYDSKGELRCSQNAKQLAAGTYSYTKYDNLGRIIEVGESSQSIGSFNTQPKLDSAAFPINHNAQRTFTVYSTPASNVYYINMQTQTYLQNRVSYTYNDDGAYTYYSYDPHGNVAWLIQDMPGLGKNYIRYEYDLISNKVLKVHYNEGSIDEFHHRYSYDEDQRLTYTETSRNQHIWDRDAKYTYFKHGPLRRAEIGDDKIQGIDYTYTIQGWLKGINYVSTKNTDDPGADGTNSFPRDVFGMVIGYEPHDFNRSGSLFNPSNPRLISSIAGDTAIFNGNISSITYKKDSVSGSSSLDSANAFQYRYDQLNRIKKETFKYYKNAGSWQSTTDYFSHYTYDDNGNLDTLIRNGYAAVNTSMDQLKYHYNSGTNQLNYVTDPVAAGNYSVDIDNESVNNYLYDQIGNLTSDVAGNISNIAWTVYGKVKSVKKTNGDSIKFVYDPSGNRIMKLFKPNGGSDTITYYVRDAKGNVMSVYKRSISSTNYTYTQQEVPIYGSSRIGEFKPFLAVRTVPTTGCMPCNSTCGCISGTVYQWTISNDLQNGYSKRLIGKKFYELTDHLGDVRAIVSDRKRSTNTDSTLAYMNYYAFGMEMPNKQYSAGSYRYGFNGKEKDNETYGGDGNEYDYEARIYDPRIGRWLGLDPLQAKYPHLSPYLFSENNPIYFNDPSGKDAVGKVDGNTITISAVIYIVGANDTKAKAAEMQLQINKIWGKPDLKYTDEKGNVYNIKFDITVRTIEVGKSPTDESTNLVRLVDNKDPKYRSKVKDTWYGLWEEAPQDPKVYAHEVGHLLGLADSYADLVPDDFGGNNAYYGNRAPTSMDYPGTDPNEIMGEGVYSKDAKVTQKDINAIASFVLKNKDGNGKSVISKKNLDKTGNKKGLAAPTAEQSSQLENQANQSGYTIKPAGQ